MKKKVLLAVTKKRTLIGQDMDRPGDRETHKCMHIHQLQGLSLATIFVLLSLANKSLVLN